MTSKASKPKGNMYTLGTQSIFHDIILQELEGSKDNLQFCSVITEKYPIGLTKWVQLSAFKKRVSLTKKLITIFKFVNINAKSKTTIIYSHGISKNLDKIFPFLIDLCSILKCCVICYDYSEFDNKNTIEHNLANDLETVINFTMDYFKIKLYDVFLLSSSLGSLPTFSICARERFKKIKGIIAVSPLSYGAAVYRQGSKASPNKIELCNSKKEGYYSIYQYTEKIFIPTLIIHGKKDRVIPVNQSTELAEKMIHAKIWTPKNGTHDNIFTFYRRKFFLRLKGFIAEQISSSSNLNSHSSLNLNEENKAAVKVMDILQSNLLDISLTRSTIFERSTALANTSLDCIDFNINTYAKLGGIFKPGMFNENKEKELMEYDKIEKEESI